MLAFATALLSSRSWIHTVIVHLADQTLTGLDPLCPLRPASIIKSSCNLRIAGFRQCRIDDCCCHACSTAIYDRLGRVDAFCLEHFKKLICRQECLVLRIEEVGDGHRDGVWDMAG